MAGPRVYNLFPLLAGPVEQWGEHLPRIADLRFNWVFLNPFHQTGASGSLYAVKDYYQLNPFFQGKDGNQAGELLHGFLQRAEEHKLSVMMDLVLNHTAKDSPLVEQHPDWYVHNEDGSVRSPRAKDSSAPGNVVVWEDLAELDYDSGEGREHLIKYWKDVVRRYTKLGFHGFRCDAAYQVPGNAWKEIIAAGREVNPDTQFFAETLGAKPKQVKQLREAGFDYFFNSAKWWDFHDDWLLKQYEQFRHIAPSIAFPESHDTQRVAEEKGGDERQSRLWYLFAAFFSAGVMMPVGYEYGFRKKLHVVKTRPKDWEKPSFDLSSSIAAANEMKERTPVLNEEGPQERITPPEDSLVGLLRRSDHSGERAVALINTESDQQRDFAVTDLQGVLEGKREAIREITPSASGDWANGDKVTLPPLSMRVFHRAES